MSASPGSNVHHTVLGMLLALCGSLAALDIKVRILDARVMRATLVANIHHAIFSILLAECSRLAAFEVEGQIPRTAIM